MYSGQFEIRNRPLAGEPSSGAAEVAGALDFSPELHAARTEGPSASAAAVAAPPPRNRRRDVRFAASRASSRGSVLSGMGGLSWIRALLSLRGSGRAAECSGVLEH